MIEVEKQLYLKSLQDFQDFVPVVVPIRDGAGLWQSLPWSDGPERSGGRRMAPWLGGRGG